jgi:hypothetical protein
VPFSPTAVASLFAPWLPPSSEKAGFFLGFPSVTAFAACESTWTARASAEAAGLFWTGVYVPIEFNYDPE